ncbi:TPA: hypothetical protein L6B67_30320 [Pseudomonas aeruginosa]|nr:hypothetical protein [Pseudomonas aeruginosa]
MLPYARYPGERPVRDDGAGGSGLCGSSEREVLHGALLLNRKCKLLKSKEKRGQIYFPYSNLGRPCPRRSILTPATRSISSTNR